jgi:hypothetical protein
MAGVEITSEHRRKAVPGIPWLAPWRGSRDAMCSKIFETLYHVYFRDHRLMRLVYLCDYVLSLGYIAMNVLVWGREETRVLSEGLLLAAVLLLTIPLLYVVFRVSRA